jgi:S-adenosylmethionine decarboxylase
MFGPHLTLDLYGCNEEKMSNEEFIYNILDDLPNFISMTKISEPNVVFHEGNSDSFDKGGVSGFVLIAESHISIHTFRGYGFASVDVFSCKPFDVKKATEYLIEKFEAKKAEKHLISRGREFPRSIEKVKRIVKKQREAFV